MMNPILLDTIKEIIERADEAREKLRKEPKNEVQSGRVLAFAEVLSVIKTDFTGIADVEELLNFDIDERYFGK